MTPNRIVHCQDAINWLSSAPLQTDASFVTSLPDFSEFPELTLQEWKTWFIEAARLVLARTPPDAVAIFYQTDIRKDGAWVDKGYLCQKAAEAEGVELIWHKAVARVRPGMASFGRAGFSHLLCFSRGVRADIARSTPDILTDAGAVTWTRGTGLKVCELACRFILEQTATRTVIDPFCGHGSVLVAANELGLDAVGIEKSAKRARIARNMTLGALTDGLHALPAESSGTSETSPC